MLSTTPRTERERLDATAVALLIAIVVLAPIARGWVLWSAPGGDEINQWVLMTPLDWPLAVLIVLQLASALEDRRAQPRPARRGISVPAALLAVTLAWVSIAALVHPSWRAVDLAFRLVGVWAIVRTVRRADGSQRVSLLVALVVLGTMQAVLGIAQSREGEALGLGILEFEGPLYVFGGVPAGRGSLTHPYHLTALLVVCVPAAALLARSGRRGRPLALVALAVMATSIVLTFSRSGFLAVAAMFLLWAFRRKTALLAGALGVGLLVGAALGADGLDAKAEVSTKVDQVDSGRRERLREAFALANQEPLIGVGPGQYVIELREIEHEDLLPAHNIGAQYAAETGYVGGVLVLATLAAFGIWMVRRSLMVLAVGASLVPFHLLDTYPHTFPLGIVISAFWLSLVVIADDEHQQASDQRPAESTDGEPR